jgi:hypothetical protein
MGNRNTTRGHTNEIVYTLPALRSTKLGQGLLQTKGNILTRRYH